MKAVTVTVIFCLLLILAAPIARAVEAPAAALPIAAPSAVLLEKETGTVLYEKDADTRRPPASVTKVMTLLLLIEDVESGRLALDDTVTASARAASFGGSCVYLEQGERMSVDDMLKCIAVVSANDCAVAMAEHVSGTEEVFVGRMNRRAEELGCRNTHFTNCTGLFEDAEHYSSARDIALMSRALLRHELIKRYTTIWMDSIRGGAFELTNTNKLVAWYPGCTGLKTGYTSEAMYCLAASAERDGVEFISVVLHGESIDARNADATTLLNYAFANYALCSLVPENPLPALPVDMGKAPLLALRLEGEDWAVTPRGGAQAEYRLELPGLALAPVQEGEPLGTLTVTRGGETLAVRPVVAAETVERLDFFGVFVKLAGSLVGIWREQEE